MLAPVEPNHHYLPSLGPESNVPMPPTSAHWSAQPSGLLQAVGNGIAVDDSATARGVSSVPDVWARAVLFQAALRPSHPLHAQAVADWRGLLSLLALREVYGYDVEVVPVNLTGGGKLPAALRTLAPPPVELEPGKPYGWTDVLLVRLEGVPIGAFSPGSLVYTATGYRDRLRAHYEPEGGEPRKRPDCLDADYGLVAPTKASDEHSAHFVAEYVHDLYQTCSSALSGAPEAQRISELLDAWLKELRNAFGYNPQERINAPEVKTAQTLPSRGSAADWPGMAGYGIYRAALLPLVPDEIDDGPFRKSSIFLRHKRNHTDLRGVVVVHKDTLTEGARVWGLRRLASLGETVQDALDTHFNAPRGSSIGGEDLARLDAAWVRPERYFLTDVLLAPRDVTKALASDEQAANAGGEFVLPFRREVLEFFGPEDIQSVLRPRFEHQRDGGVKFSFDLPVGDHPDLAPSGDGQFGAPPAGGFGGGGFGEAWGSGGGPAARSEPGITVERVYRVKREGDPDDGSGAIQKVDLPVLDLFPDYLGPSWRRYWLFQSDADRFDCRPYAHGAAVDGRDRKDVVDGVERSARVTEVHGDDPFPDGVEVRAANGIPGGLLVTKRPLWDESGVSGQWVVGIDFGTSNTNVSKRQGSNPVEGWAADFPSHLRTLTADPAGRRDDLLQAFFVPNRRVEFPAPTLLDIRSPNPGAGRAVLDYFALFPDGYTWAPRIRTDIKWDAEGSRVTEFFLESVLLLILMEVTRNRVKSVDLRCTYPKAFSAGEVEVLKGEWERTLQALTTPGNPAAAVGAVPNQTVSVSEPSHHSEGRMAGTYFSSDSAIEDARQRAKTSRAVCVDVGGGTTDLALLYDGDIVYDSSIRMAGRDIAEYIALRPRLREALFTDEAQAALKDAQTDRKLFGARLNGVLRRETDRIPDQLNRQAANPDVVRLRQLIALKFGALAFHVGTVLGAAEKHGVAPGLAQKLKEGGISVHWGGNGGQLATWIDFGRYRPDGLAAKILNGLLYYALSDAEAVPNGSMLLQAQSPSPKGEAVKGVAVYEGVGETTGGGGVPDFLLDDEPGGDGAARSIDGVISGETITLTDGCTVGFLDVVNLATLFDGDKTRFARSSGDRLRRFVDLFNRLGAQFDLITADTKIPDNDATITAITEKAQDRYVQMQDRKESQRSVEPVFITEVRELMRHVASSTR
jgi:hypothetical protein